MNSGTIRKIADYSDRLRRLTVLYEEKEFDPAIIDEELWNVCRLVWKFTPDDVDDEALPADVQDWVDRIWDNDDPHAAQKFALAHGYDLFDLGKPLPGWWWFTLMILGQVHGIMTPEHIAASRLRAEAEKFRENKEAGVVSGS